MRQVATEQKLNCIHLIESGMGQREIQRVTGLSRTYIRKLSRIISHQFPRNGIEIIGELCMCVNCGNFYRRPKSKIENNKHNFCTTICKKAFLVGPNHPNWKTGDTSRSFSSWVQSQSEYKKWRDKVLDRDGNKCIITGSTEKLNVHHIMPKAENFHPDKVFDVNNGITLCEEAHREVHKLIREGIDFHKAIKVLAKRYREKEELHI